MSASDVESIKKQTRTYIGVFVALLVLTLVTVGVSYLHISSVFLALALGLLIACVKGGLVASVFMHLNHERKIIYWVLALTVLFFIVLMIIPVASHLDQRAIQ